MPPLGQWSVIERSRGWRPGHGTDEWSLRAVPSVAHCTSVHPNRVTQLHSFSSLSVNTENKKQSCCCLTGVVQGQKWSKVRINNDSSVSPADSEHTHTFCLCVGHIVGQLSEMQVHATFPAKPIRVS